MNTILRTPNGALGHGASNRGRFSDPVLDDLLARAERELDDTAREALTRDAVRRAMAEAGIVPVFFVRAAWGTRRGFSLTPRGDQYTMATAIRAMPAGAAPAR
jgi:peptide/nickel transport system substrate-binding protein